MSGVNRRNSVLWHTMQEGTVTVKKLAELTGWNILQTRDALTKTTDKALLNRLHPRKNPAEYGLTPMGIEQALQVNARHVEFASSEAAVAAILPITTPPLPEPAQAASPSAPEPLIDPARSSAFDSILQLSGLTKEEFAAPPVTEVQPQAFGWAEQAAQPKYFQAEDLVCAINSKGELVLDLGDANNIVVQFKPAQALKLQSFLDNVSLLYELSAKGRL